MDDVGARIAALVVALVVAGALGLLVRSRSGRARPVRGGAVLSAAELGIARLGRDATYLQLSSPACSPCRSVARVLSGITASSPGLGHVELDATQRLDLARRLEVLRTPTVLVLDPAGLVVSRFSGAVTAQQALAALPEAARSARPEGARP